MPLNPLLHSIGLNDEGQNISDRDFNAIRTMIYQEAGISLSDGKRALVCSRLAKRLRHLNLRNHAEYLDYLATRDPEGAERQVMINCLTTNKTDFFREAHHFTFLREHVFPRIERAAAQGGPRRLRIWSAACSTGEEPYSVAMTILEHFGSLRGWDVQVLASDINTEVLQKAAEGVYASERIDGLEDRIQRKYFLRGTGLRAGFCQVRPEVRRLVAFRQINFMDQSWPLRTRFDVIFCRNVIIYFDAPTQEQLLPRLVGQLTDNGYLILGHSENLYWLADLLAPLGNTVYQRRSGIRLPMGDDSKPAATRQRTAEAPDPVHECGNALVKTWRREIIAGEFFAARQPTVISTILGSCVAACLFDPAARIGGLNHFMLPFHASDLAVSARYGVHAMELLINEIMKLGGDRRRLRAKVFGGANVFRFTDSPWNVGRCNVEFVRKFLESENIPVLAERLGGEEPLRVHFVTATGKAFVKAIASSKSIIEREQFLDRRASEQLNHPSHDQITLF
jgi:chemotaxis protein methyltransferase CheR